MNFEPRFCMKISKMIRPDEVGCGEMYLTLQRPFMHLEDELRQAFASDQTATVIVDQRVEDRRKTCQPVTEDRRIMQRRKPKEEIIEVLINI